jgi:hypothetical protein
MEKLRAFVAEHPLLAMGGAMALGAIVSASRSRRPRGRVSGAVAGALGAIVIGVIRDYAIRQVSGYARSWIDETERQRADDVTSHNREVEAFLEHS